MIVDILYTVMFPLFYPFATIYYLFSKEKRCKRFAEELKKVECELKYYDIAAIEDELSSLVNKTTETSSSGYTSHSGVESTDWYKDRVDDHYRRIMNLPPRDDGLPKRASDVTLDMHPGDY